MAQSLSRVLVHLIFSTKNRQPLIPAPLQARLHAYMAGILTKIDCPSLQIGGVADHTHILLAQSRTLALSEVVEQVKKNSSKWMKTEGVAGFSWQAGYGAFSIGESQIEKVVCYINQQDEHHRTVSFQEEYRQFLLKYRVPYDERYVWD